MSSQEQRFKGPIAWMAQNSVAANLLMAIVIVIGLISMVTVKQEVFPEFSLDLVSVQVPYPGASPEEVEQGIVLAVEEAVRGVDGVKRVTSTSAEGLGAVNVELLLSADPEKVLADVKNEIDRIATFPEDAEEPTVALATNRQKVISLVIAGDQDLVTLHGIAEVARAGMLESPDVTQVEVQGIPPLEIAVEVPRETMEAYGLSPELIAMQIRGASLELPGGNVETDNGQILVRLSDRRTTGHELEDVVVRGTAGGGQVRLGDIATIHDGFADTDQSSFLDGRRAVRVTAYRVGDETPTGVAAAVRAYSDQLQAELGDAVAITVWDDDSEILRDRIDLLIRNARMGLILVVFVLALFLDLRLALWVAVGIPVSFLGAFLLMPTMDVSVNMISLFALIVTLGMVVDDAIVIGENTYHKLQTGMGRVQAAIEGAQEMAMPVTFAILTTIAAFAPLMFVPGVMGKIFRIMPLVVIAVLAFSLFESFFVLPAHLAHLDLAKKGKVMQILDKPRAAVDRWMQRFIERRFWPLLGLAVDWRHATMAGATAALFVAIGAVASGVVPFSFFPNLEGDVVTVSVRMPYGAPLDRTEAIVASLNQSLESVAAGLDDQTDVVATFAAVGEGPDQGFGVRETGGHLATVEVKLVPTAEREFTAEEFAGWWQQATPPLPGVEAVVFNSSFGPGAGAAVDVQLSHTDTDVLAAASSELAQVIRGYPDLMNISNSYTGGKPQFDFHLLDNARTLGLTGDDVARQLRSSFYGAEALREQRGRNEIKVMVRLPEAQRASEYDLDQLMIRTPEGGSVPLRSVASFERGYAPTTIDREEGARFVRVSAELAPGVASPQQVLKALEEDDLPAMEDKYPGLKISMAGEQREQAEAFGSLARGYGIGLIAIFGLLAIPLRSYTQPLVIMSAIPFGIVGAVAGHFVMGFSLSIISMFGIVALSGVVVNDSLVLIDAANTFRNEGMSPAEAIMSASVRRLRPILLTSLTTFFGLAPMIFETSIQARFLIPMAISLGFGVLFATGIVLVVVPALYMILDDLHRVWSWIWTDEPEVVTVEVREA